MEYRTYIWGASIYDYLWGGSTSSLSGNWLDGQVSVRNVEINIIRTSPDQDAQALNEFFRVYNRGYSISDGDTCATAVSSALKYGVGLSSVSVSRFPAQVQRDAFRYSSVDINLPEGSAFPWGIYGDYLGQFENLY